MVQKDRIADSDYYGTRSKSGKKSSEPVSGSYKVKYYARENPTFAKSKQEATDLRKTVMNHQSRGSRRSNPTRTGASNDSQDKKSIYNSTSRDDSEKYHDRGRATTKKRCTSSFDSAGGGTHNTSSSSIASNLVPPPSFFETVMACAGWDGGYRPHEDLYDYEYDYGNVTTRRTRSLSYDRSITPPRGSRSLSSDRNWRSNEWSYDTRDTFDSYGTYRSRRNSRKRSKSKRKKKKEKNKSSKTTNKDKTDEFDNIQRLERSVSILVDTLTKSPSTELHERKNEFKKTSNLNDRRLSLEKSLSLLVDGLAKSSTDAQNTKAKETFNSGETTVSIDRRFLDKRVSLLEKAINQKISLDNNDAHKDEQSLLNFAPNLRSQSPMSPIVKQSHLSESIGKSKQSNRVMKSSPLYPLQMELSPVADDMNTSVSNPGLVPQHLMRQHHQLLNSPIEKHQIRSDLYHSHGAPHSRSVMSVPLTSGTKIVSRRNAQGPPSMSSSPTLFAKNTEPRNRKERQKLMLQQSLDSSYRGNSSSYRMSSERVQEVDQQVVDKTRIKVRGSSIGRKNIPSIPRTILAP